MSKAIRRLQLTNFLRPGAHFYLERQRFSFALSDVESPERHRHDFCECYWIEQGQGYEYCEGGSLPVAAGDLVLLRPEDAHGFGGGAGTAMVMWNLAFPQEDWLALHRRYRDELVDWFGLPAGERRLQLGAARTQLLCSQARDITRGARRRIDLDRLLLELAHLLGQRPPGRAAPPAWLADAAEAIREPRWFTLGPAALVRLSGRSAEHVARSARRHFGQTPTELVNEARLAWAAERLAASDQGIVDIALACGWNNLGCFYRSFGKRFGMPPKAWRDRAAGIVS